MKTMFRLGLILLAAAVCSNALWGAEKKRLTPMRIAALASSTKEGPEKPIAVEFSGFDLSETSKITITPGQGQMVLEKTRDVRAPIDFKQPAFFDDPDHQASPVVPGTPTAFETIKAGWTIRLQARREAGVLVLSVVADYVEVEFVNANYGELAGPITTEEGLKITPNVHTMPLKQSTTTRFNLSAEVGKTYEVVLYKGKVPETHRVKVTVP